MYLRVVGRKKDRNSISDIFEQIMSGVSHQELTETMREEIQLEERSRFRNLLLAARGQAMDYALAEAVADGQAEADILCAEDRAELEVLRSIKRSNAGILSPCIRLE